ncbi:hypothetical protein PYCCODRAFT_487476 [Trametes coccinea BRFM310]|uniref:Uncharacterized protein n=1 Tax=Trametes coccinea (strain BRFM310) TaxID=1353009 RepID=A0A1Y2ILW2_TRAC3|nr:hypothetical protein PYCCODRAFT_487476 [Trametes coccinea BRFM310]
MGCVMEPTTGPGRGWNRRCATSRSWRGPSFPLETLDELYLHQVTSIPGSFWRVASPAVVQCAPVGARPSRRRLDALTKRCVWLYDRRSGAFFAHRGMGSAISGDQQPSTASSRTAHGHARPGLSAPSAMPQAGNTWLPYTQRLGLSCETRRRVAANLLDVDRIHRACGTGVVDLTRERRRGASFNARTAYVTGRGLRPGRRYRLHLICSISEAQNSRAVGWARRAHRHTQVSQCVVHAVMNGI